uniref:Retrotransposon gag domain-containing protein n=1 Tax=Fagus sylvatica TaxID=28930 RepID=A0A2N9FAL0_FAGSY
MEQNSHVAGPSGPPPPQPPEQTPIEKQGQTLAENIQELARQNQILMEKFIHRETNEEKEVKVQMGEIRDAVKGKDTKNLDCLVHKTDSPFTGDVVSYPLPYKFCMPQLESFDGSKDPLDHLESFKTSLQGKHFVNHFIGGQRHGRPTTHMLNVKQKDGESLRSYLTKFNREVLLVNEVDDKFILTAFMSDLQPENFLFSMHKDPPSTMAEMMRVLIDNGSSTDIIYQPAFQQMKIDKSKLLPFDTPFIGFAGNTVYPQGVVTLQVTMGTYPLQAIKKVDFLVVDCPSAYNAIVGRPTLNRLRAITSTYHLLVCHEDMLGINREVMAHKLNVDPSIYSMKQKRQVFTPKRNTAVMEEVEKLLTIEFIREVYYPEWLANVVMVKKLKGSPLSLPQEH